MNRLILKCLAALTLLLAGVAELHAVPARGGSFTHQQPDGTVLTLRLVGDEYMHYYLNEVDGSKMSLGEDGHYYPISDVQFDNVLAEANARRSASQQRRMQRLSAPLRAMGQPNRAVGTFGNMTGSKKGLVILVNFADKAMTTGTQSKFNNMFNQEGYNSDGHIGSVADYFKDQSYGQFNLSFDVVGPVTLSQNMAYYGGNDANGSDLRPAQMVKEACSAVDNQVNFADYDWTGDGYVDQVFVIYAGYGENYQGSDANAIWPHEWDLVSAGLGVLTLDGKKIKTYACCAELYGTKGTSLNGMGTACHEFSHCLGYPDSYDIDYSGGIGMDSYDVMCGGSYNGPNGRGEVPSGYTAYQRWMAGWLTPTELDEAATITDMSDLGTSASAYIVYNPSNNNEYFLLENRQSQKWFSYYDYNTAGHGLFITYIDYSSSVWSQNKPNDNPVHQRMTWVPADGNYGDYDSTKKTWSVTSSQQKGDYFPGTGNVTSFTNSSHTDVYGKWFNGTSNDFKSITDITESDGKISFLFDGGDAGTRYTVTFNAGAGSCTTSSWTQTTSSSESVTLPGATIESNDWTFVGWCTANVAQSTTKPTVLKAGDSYKPAADVTLYAVYTKTEASSGSGTYTLDYSVETALADSKEWGSYGTAYSYTATDGGTWVVKAYKNKGMQINSGKDASIKVPECSSPISSIEITASIAKVFKFSNTDYTGANNPTAAATSTSSTSATLDLSGKGLTTGYIYTTDGSTSITKIVVTYGSGSTTYYATSPSLTTLPTPIIAFANVGDKEMLVGDTYTNEASASCTGVTLPAVTYSSSKTDVATVDASSGQVTAVSIGTTTIKARVEAVDGKSKAAWTTYTITVAMPTLSSIAITTPPTKTDYTEGEDFNPAGMVVMATYANGYTCEVTGYTCDPTTIGKDDTQVTVSYTEGDVTQTATVAITVTALPRYTVTFHAGAGTCGTASLTESDYQGGVTLPACSDASSVWKFAGWAEESVATATETKPTLLQAGDTYKPTADCTLFAVFAKTEGEDEVWKKVAASAVNEGGTYALITTDGHAFNGTILSGHGQVTSSAFSFDSNNEATSAPDGTCILTLTAVTGGYTMYSEDKGFLYASAASSGKLAWHQEETSYWLFKVNNWQYNANSAYLRDYNNNSFRTYSANNGSVVAFAKLTGGATVTYCSTPDVTPVGPDPEPTYTVSFYVRGEKTDLTESAYQSGVTAPAVEEVAGFVFYGWSEAEIETETTTAPALVSPVEGKYMPTANVSLYAIYKREADGTNYYTSRPVEIVPLNPAVALSAATVSFGAVAKDAEIAAKYLTATLTDVSSATVALSGEGASAFSLDKTTLTESGRITITPNTAEAGTFVATLTLSAEGATSATAEIRMTVVEIPELPEGATTVTLSAAEDADIKFVSGSSSAAGAFWANSSPLSKKGITLSGATSTNNSSYYDGSVVRFYKNNTFTLTPAEGLTIVRVEIDRNTSQSSNTGDISCDNLTASALNTTTNTNVFTGSSTSAVTFSNTDQCRLTAIRVYYTGEYVEPDPDPIIVALEVSGTPTKTEYLAGETFDPTGLVVTATYDKGDPCVITEGFEWEIDYGTGNSALVAGATSVDVMAYIGDDILSEVYTVTGLTVTEPVILTYEAKFWNNGEQYGETQTLEEGDAVVFPTLDPESDNSDYVFIGWSASEVATTDTKPTVVKVATMGTENLNFYAVYAIETEGEYGPTSTTISYETANFPTSYADAADYKLNGITYNITQGYVNGDKLQWRAAGNRAGTGTMYNKDALKNIKSIVLNYSDSDTNKNFTVKVGSNTNPADGTEITPSNEGDQYTYNCSSAKADYFVLTNGSGAGYLTSIVINYMAPGASTYSDYTTSVPEPVIVTYEAKFFAEGTQVGETQTLKNGDDVVFPDDPTPSNEDYTFIGWSTSEILTPQDAEPSLVSSATMRTEALDFYAVYAIKKRGESIEQTMDLSKGVNSGTEASSVNTWTLSDVLTITQKRGDTPSGKTQTNPNGNYLSSPRWYVYNLITFVPSREIEKVTVTSTTTGYASALQSSTYTNASASLKEEGGSVVYITPTDGNESFSVIMSGQSRISSISVTVAGGETYSGYTTTLPGNERETPTITMDDISLAWGEELALAATTTPVDLEVTYSIKSGSENVAISAGVLKCIGVGSAVITATTIATAQYKSASIDVNVDVTVPVGIAAIRRQISSTLSGSPDPIMAQISNAVVTYVSSSATPTIYVEDENAGIAIYMKNTGLNPGDVINGTITGAGYVYNGLTEISQLDLSSASITSGGEIPCTDVTIADLTVNISGWASRRVRLSQVTVSAAIDNRNATVAQGDNSITVRESIGGCTSDLFGTEGASIAYIVGYPQAYNSTPQLSIWSADDVFVAYNRSVTAGNWGTICLPRAVDLELSEDVKFYNIAGTSLKNGKIDGIVLVEEIEDLEAGKPYLFKATSSELKLYCFGVAAELPADATGLVGNFSGNLLVPAGCYVLSSNKIRMVLEDAVAYAGPNRAYIDLDGVGEYDGSSANALRFGFDGEVEDYTTYIQTVQYDAEVEIFDLLGNKVQTMKKGQLYIVNGKKMFNK